MTQYNTKIKYNDNKKLIGFIEKKKLTSNSNFINLH